MGDKQDFEAMISYGRSASLSRRQFAALSVGAGLTSFIPERAPAAELADGEVVISTGDGECDAYFVHPAKGSYPGVLVWPDIFGLRPTFRQMAQRLAGSN